MCAHDVRGRWRSSSSSKDPVEVKLPDIGSVFHGRKIYFEECQADKSCWVIKLRADGTIASSESSFSGTSCLISKNPRPEYGDSVKVTSHGKKGKSVRGELGLFDKTTEQFTLKPQE